MCDKTQKKIHRLAQKDFDQMPDLLTNDRLVKKAKAIFDTINIDISSIVPGTLRDGIKKFAENHPNISLQQQQWLFFEALRLMARKSNRSAKTTIAPEDALEDALDNLKQHVLDKRTKLLTDKTLDEEMPYHKKGSILTFDLDHFKAINDTYGHDAGNEALKYFSSALKEIKLSDAFKNQDIDLYRNGGDEFVVVIENDTNKKLSKEFAKAVQAKLDRDPFTYNNAKPYLGTSIGIGTYSRSTTFKEALIKSDGAAYRNKEERREKRKLDQPLPLYSTRPLKMTA